MPATLIDLEKKAVLPTSIPRYVTNGVGIDAHDIKTINVGEMLNKMVKILMRCKYFEVHRLDFFITIFFFINSVPMSYH